MHLGCGLAAVAGMRSRRAPSHARVRAVAAPAWTRRLVLMTLELETSEACYKRMPRAVSFALIAFASDSAAAPPPTAGSSVAGARPRSGNDKDPRLIAKAEVLLDRVHFSSGEIDGFDGDNFRNAI